MTATHADVSDSLATAFLRICPEPANLVAPAGYRDSALSLIDAVFSMQARYEGVLAVVHRYVTWAGIESVGLPTDPREADEHDLAQLLERIGDIDPDDLAREVFESRAKSPSANRLKAELIIDAARRLTASPVGVVARQDVETLPDGARYRGQKQAWTSVPGLGPVTFEYFRMLCGAESSKPDIMLLRWLEAATGRRSSWQQALVQIRDLSQELERHWGQPVSQRAVDHVIWLHQSGRDPEPVVYRPGGIKR